MKIFANKEIKKLFLTVSVIWVASLLLTQGSYGCAISGFLCSYCSFSYWQEGLYWRCVVPISKNKIKSWNRRYHSFMSILTAITMPVLNVMMRANYIGCFILSILWRLS